MPQLGEGPATVSVRPGSNICGAQGHQQQEDRYADERGERADRQLARREQVEDLKTIFVYLARKALAHVGYEPLLDNANQQYLGSSADIAIEVLAFESAVLRTIKLHRRHGAEATRLPESLTRLHFDYAADRVRQEATEIAASMLSGNESRKQLATLRGMLPLGSKRLDLRTEIAAAIVKSKGALPDFRN